MLQTMQVISPLVVTPPFTFDEDGTANSDKIQIRDIEGLDPVNATINTTAYGNIDGAFFTGAQRITRNIVLDNWSTSRLCRLYDDAIAQYPLCIFYASYGNDAYIFNR